MNQEDTEDQRTEELASLAAIFPELQIDPADPYSASLAIPVKTPSPIVTIFGADETEYQLSHFPPLRLAITLPDGYPESKPPEVVLTTDLPWLSAKILRVLTSYAAHLWKDYGQCQIVYSYIDYLQQCSEQVFDTVGEEGVLWLDVALREYMISFDRAASKEVFDHESFDCGVCLEPKKGSACHRMIRCGHVYCRSCLQNVYNNAITGGEVQSIVCLDPDCGAKKDPITKRVTKSSRTLGPGELLQMDIDRSLVQRYVDLKRKKKIESDKNTIYCPRQWCQGPARSAKYPKVTDLSRLENYDSDNEDNTATQTTQANGTTSTPKKVDVDGRLVVCEDCEYAFCRVCIAGWHGDYIRCYPRNTTELTEEERQSYKWIMENTSPCPYCSTPTQKSHGCNHMTCPQCRTHFCYLCSSWLEPTNPYQHFNREGAPCFRRLWDLEEGDGQGEGGGALQVEGPRGWEAALEAVAEAEAHEEQAANDRADVALRAAEVAERNANAVATAP